MGSLEDFMELMDAQDLTHSPTPDRLREGLARRAALPPLPATWPAREAEVLINGKPLDSWADRGEVEYLPAADVGEWYVPPGAELEHSNPERLRSSDWRHYIKPDPTFRRLILGEWVDLEPEADHG